MIVRFILDVQGDLSVQDVIDLRGTLRAAATLTAPRADVLGMEDHRHDGPFDIDPCDSCTALAEEVLGASA